MRAGCLRFERSRRAIAGSVGLRTSASSVESRVPVESCLAAGPMNSGRSHSSRLNSRIRDQRCSSGHGFELNEFCMLETRIRLIDRDQSLICETIQAQAKAGSVNR